MEPKVIIADDHRIVRMGLGSLIKQLGVNVVDEVSNCAELMSQLNNQTYSHLILDLIMPDGNALEIIENINNLYPNLPEGNYLPQVSREWRDMFFNPRKNLLPVTDLLNQAFNEASLKMATLIQPTLR
jgi:CheY-like chemotaxis protein